MSLSAYPFSQGRPRWETTEISTPQHLGSESHKVFSSSSETPVQPA